MKRHLFAVLAVTITVLTVIIGGSVFTPSASAWKCELHPEKAPYCTPTTTVPVTVNTTIVQSTTSTPTTVPDTTTSTPTTTPNTTTTTSTTVPDITTSTTVPTPPDSFPPGPPQNRRICVGCDTISFPG